MGVKNNEGEKRKDVGNSGGGSGVRFDEGKAGKVAGAGGVRVEEKVFENCPGKESNVVLSKHIYVHKYMLEALNLLWAVKGVVVNVLNDEAIPVVQRRIFYGGFERLDIIPLGADKVLVRSMDDKDVNVMFSEASIFFGNFFSTPVKWNKEILVHEGGAWVRIYCVPLNAWNINFFQTVYFLLWTFIESG